MAKKKDDKPEIVALVKAAQNLSPTDETSKDTWPTLYELLRPIWKDGKCLRQAATIKLRLAGPYYLVTLSCPTEGLEATLTTDTLVCLFDQMEEFLASAACPWMPDWQQAKKSRQARL